MLYTQAEMHRDFMMAGTCRAFFDAVLASDELEVMGRGKVPGVYLLTILGTKDHAT